jgi:hypothetical protein
MMKEKPKVSVSSSAIGRLSAESRCDVDSVAKTVLFKILWANRTIPASVSGGDGRYPALLNTQTITHPSHKHHNRITRAVSLARKTKKP